MEKYNDYAVASFETLKKMSDEYKQGVNVLQEERREDQQEQKQEEKRAEQLPENEMRDNGKNIVSKKIKKANPTFNLFLFALIVDLISNR